MKSAGITQLANVLDLVNLEFFFCKKLKRVALYFIAGNLSYTLLN